MEDIFEGLRQMQAKGWSLVKWFDRWYFADFPDVMECGHTEDHLLRMGHWDSPFDALRALTEDVTR